MKKYYYYIIVIFAFILYGNTIPNYYALDDLYVTGDNHQIMRGIEGIPDIFTSFYTELNDIKFAYRPIVKVSFAIEYELFGANPHISHLINILLYALSGLLLFRLLYRKMFVDFPESFSFFIVILFMAHPVHTEVVASLKNRDEILSFLFSLVALHYVFKYFDTGKFYHIPIASVIFFIAYLSKPSALVYLALIPLCIYFFRKVKLKKLFLILASMLIVAIIARYLPKWILEHGNRGYHFIENPLIEGSGIMKAFGTGMLTMLHYLKMIFIPYPMSFYYGYDMIPIVGIFNPIAIISLLIHLGLFVFAIIKIKKKHIISFSILFYLVALSMFSNIVKPAMGIVAERYMFTAVLGFSIIIVYLIYSFQLRKTKNTKKIFSGTLVILLFIIIPFSALTIDRNFDWKDELTLYRHDIKHLEKSAKANDLLAGTLFAEARKIKKANPEKAKESAKEILHYYGEATKIYPQFANAWNNMGSVYFELTGDFEKARQCFSKAVSIKPDYMKAVFNYAHVNDILNEVDTAEIYYKIVLTKEPHHKNAWSSLANLYFRKGKIKLAVKTNEKMMEMLPQSDIPYVNIGKYYLYAKDTAAAIPYLEKALQKKPNNYNLSVNLYNYFRLKGDKTKAGYYYKLSVKNKKLQ